MSFVNKFIIQTEFLVQLHELPVLLSHLSEFIQTPETYMILYSTHNRENKLNKDYFNTLRTGDADLRFYITSVQDG